MLHLLSLLVVKSLVTPARKTFPALHGFREIPARRTRQEEPIPNRLDGKVNTPQPTAHGWEPIVAIGVMGPAALLTFLFVSLSCEAAPAIEAPPEASGEGAVSALGFGVGHSANGLPIGTTGSGPGSPEHPIGGRSR
jgi:hypothetical protein